MQYDTSKQGTLGKWPGGLEGGASKRTALPEGHDRYTQRRAKNVQITKKEKRQAF